MTDYQGKNDKQKEEGEKKPKQEQKVVERITSEQVVIRKKGPWKTFKGLIIEADMGSVGRFLWFDLLIPAFKNMLVDTVEQGVRRTVYGGRAPYYRSTPGQIVASREPRTTYGGIVSRPYTGSQPSAMPQQSMPAAYSVSRPANEARAYTIVRKDEALEVLERMVSIVERFGVVTVADLHVMLNLEHNPVENDWGWFDLQTAQIRQIREGWLLELPEPQSIRR